EDEALRELVRIREATKADRHRVRQRILKFLLRHQIEQPATIKVRWTKKHIEWLKKLTFPYGAMQLAFDEMLHTLCEINQRMARLEKELVAQAESHPKAPLSPALQPSRGIGLLTAITLVAEIGTFS